MSQQIKLQFKEDPRQNRQVFKSISQHLKVIVITSNAVTSSKNNKKKKKH